MEHELIVSVVIPAHNAESTLSSTLHSVCGQTYRHLEVIVVDDGSTDGTRALAEAAARHDPRIRVISTANAGVAAARNIGIAASRGAYVAPVDADDLWHPTKIEKQLAAMAAGGPEIGFVYTYYRRIDDADRVLYDGPPWRFEGRVFLPMLLLNFVGNGSSLLIRREALDRAGGYEPALQAGGAQGCEDYLVQLLIARDWQVAVVPEFLTGYRMTPGAMSSARERMTRSHLLMLDLIRARFPDVPREALAASAAQILGQHAAYQLFRDPAAAARTMRAALGHSVSVALRVGSTSLRRRLVGMAERRLPRRRAAAPFGERAFLAIAPDDGPAAPPRYSLARALARLAGGAGESVTLRGLVRSRIREIQTRPGDRAIP
jgi:hypothetical protein